MPWSFASLNIESATATVVESIVVLVPLTVKSPVTVKLSLIVVSDVECPIEIGTPEVAVAIVIPLVVLELSIFKVVVLSNEILEPSTTSVPSISVLSKLAVPSTSKSPLKSALPPSVKVVAMSTAPSISTISKFAVPSTSISPARSIPAAPAKTRSSADVSHSIYALAVSPKNFMSYP